MGRRTSTALARLLCVLVALMTARAAAAQQLSSVAVLELEARKGVTTEESAQLTKHLEAALARKGRFERLVSFAELRKQMAQAHPGGDGNAACTDDSCVAQVAAAVGVRFLVAGNVTRLQDTLVLDVRVLETATAHPAARSNQFVTHPTPENILAAMDLVVDELVAQGSWAGTTPAAPKPEEKTAAPPTPQPRALWPLAAVGAAAVAGAAVLALLTGTVMYGSWMGSLALLPISPTEAWLLRGGIVGNILLAVLSTLAVLGAGGAAAAVGVLGVVWRPLSLDGLDKVMLALLGTAGGLGLVLAAAILLGGLGVLTVGLTLAGQKDSPLGVAGLWAVLGLPLLAPGLLAGPLLAACALGLAGVLWWMHG